MFNFYRFLLGTLCVVAIAAHANNIEGIQFYQKKNLALSEEHKQKLADDINRYHHADNIWDVLRDQFTLPHEEDNPAVQDKIDWFMNNQDFLLRSATRAAPYLYYISQQVKKRHLPAELVLLPIIESGYNPFSLSSMGAAGIWQLMPDTATGLGIKQDWGYDGRRDVIASTRAALSYLAYLQNFFDGNWLYAIAAYNTGEGNVLSAIKKNIRAGQDTDFWSLPVAQQTKDYVPSLLALAIIITHPERYPIYFPPVRNAPYLAQVDIDDAPLNLKHAAMLAGISYKKLIQLNPGFIRLSTTRTHKLVLPIENVEQFTENLSRLPSRPHAINWIHYKVRSGDTLASISKKFKTSVLAIRKLNHLDKEVITHGTNLLIPIEDTAALIPSRLAIKKTKEIIIENRITKMATKPSYHFPKKYVLIPGDTIYMVRANDTLSSIAKRFNVSIEALQATHQFKNEKPMAGKQIIIPTHLHLLAEKNVQRPSNKKDIFYVVRKGDTIEKIAKKFNTKPAAIRLANLMKRNSLQTGESILIPAAIRG